MTREEAIKHLSEWMDEKMWRCFGTIDREAIGMAIEALKILGESGIVNCCGCIHWKSDGGAIMECELWKVPMGDFDFCSYGEREAR